MLRWIRKLWFECRCRFGRTYMTRQSKKPTKLCGRVTAFGETFELVLNPGKDGLVDYSHDEIGATAIACVACGKPIIWTQPIGLLIPGEGYKIPEGSYLYEPEGAYAACFRWECEHPFRRGFWLPTEEDPMTFGILRTAGPDEILMANPDLECVIIGNTHDIKAAVDATNALAQSQRSSAPSE